MKVLTNNQYYSQIADIIREQNGTSNTYTPPQMVSALKDLFYEEVEGAPPITFQGIGENLLDYRIDGASGGVGERTKNLFNFNKWSENLTANGNNELIISNNSITITAIENDAFTTPYSASHPNVYRIDVLPNSQYVLSWDSNNTLSGKIFAFKNGLSGTGNYIRVDNATQKYITFSTDENTNFITIRFGAMNAGDSITYSHIQLEEGSTATDYEPYGYKVPVVINGKNLLNTKLSTTQLGAGITFQKNNDGTVVLNGTPSSNFSLLAFPVYLNAATYVLSGCPESQDNTKLRCDLRDSQYATVGGYDIGNGVIISVNSPGNYFFGIRVGAGYNCNNLKFYPMIRLSTIEDDTYEQYIEPTTTNIYLDNPIDAKANIPSEYEEVEYIESTGTQYINTNIIPTNTTGVEAKISICANNNKDNIIMGCRATGSGDNRYWIDVDWTGSGVIIFGFNSNTPANDRYVLKNSDVGKPFIISMNYMNDRAGKVNGETYDTSLSSKTLASITHPMYIFAGNRSGDTAYQYAGKLYNLKITNGTNVIKNFIPCYRKSDNVAGLYDLVNDVFYTNQGTGNFIVGPIKENESISLSDTNVDIPTIRGTNVLTVDTTVQPSNVYVKSRHESSYEAAMRERYEEAQAQLDALESGGE